jgi:hypothetical protein
MKERPILLSVTTGEPSKRGKRLKSRDGLTWKQRNRDAVNARRRKLYADDPDKHRARQRMYKSSEAKPNILAYNRAWSSEYRTSLRNEMRSAYGGSCACCGESESMFLQMDHVFNDGHLDRKDNNSSAKLWAKLKKQGWPKDRYQLLCANCNFGKAMNGGVCPHQSRRVNHA